MKISFKFFLLPLVTGLATFVCGFYGSSGCPPFQAKDELTWLKLEFHLSKQQIENIKKIHQSYSPLLLEKCRECCDAQEKATQMLATHQTLTPEVEMALQGCSGSRSACNVAMAEYIYAVSRELNPKDAQRYVEQMKCCFTGSHSPPISSGAP